MKQTLLTILSFTTLLGLKAQVTVTSADFPVIGTSAILVNDSTPSVTIGGSGAGLTWDLANILQHTIDTNNFIDPTTTPFTNDFSTSNVALSAVNQDAYFTNSATEATLDGFAGDPLNLGFQTAIVYSNVETLITFPASLGTSFNDTAGFTMTTDMEAFGLTNKDSLRIIRTMYTVSTMDAEGNVTTPGGTFSSARQYKIQESIDSIYIFIDDFLTATALGVTAQTWELAPVGQFIPENPILDTTYTYTWYANGETSPVAEITTDVNNNALTAQYLYKNNLLGFAGTTTQASCAVSCDGTGEVSAVGGIASAYTYTWPNGATTAMATGVCSGTNNVTISDGAQSTVVIVLVGESLTLSASINAFSPATCGTCADGSASVIGSGGATPYTYLWDDASAQTTADATNLLPGSYSCTITDNNGCSSISSAATVTGINQAIINNMITVFPNPSNGFVTINSNDVKASSYAVYNSLGAVVLSGTINATTEVVELNTLENGLYFLDIQSDKGIIKKKITLVK
ncbi:MAG: T9SS type A sorting domain-containing protein [Flavobacteriales bacterium]|nr:T9SS type A sorting domain-containing protein [Flavobacteriales bacterium]